MPTAVNRPGACQRMQRPIRSVRRMWPCLVGRAVNPVKAGRERDQSNGVVVFARIKREAIVEALRLDFIENSREFGGNLRQPKFIVAFPPRDRAEQEQAGRGVRGARR